MSDRINVIRAPRDSEHSYFAISRALTQDRRLSFEARGVLAYLLSKPSNWEVRIADLMKEGNCGRDRIYRILKELKEAGYLHRDQEHQPNGAFTWGPYRVYEEPFTEKPEMATPQQKASQPFTEKPYTVKPDTENTDMVKLGIPHQEEAQPFTPLPYTENTDIYRIESNTEKRGVQKREGEAPTHPAIALYSKLTGIKPAKFGAEKIEAQVTDLTRWRDTVKDWLASGYKPNNIVGMLDWYHGKGRHQNNNAPANRKPTDLQTITAADEAQKKVTTGAAARRIVEETQARLKAGK